MITRSFLSEALDEVVVELFQEVLTTGGAVWTELRSNIRPDNLPDDLGVCLRNSRQPVESRAHNSAGCGGNP
jgi:hypothetical protein